ncbi:hypothetical protein YC2023_079204 [Brassica napus]
MISGNDSTKTTPYRSEDQKRGGERGGKRLASAIVTPSRQPTSMEDNVTEDISHGEDVHIG